jgi:hypothetical protein
MPFKALSYDHYADKSDLGSLSILRKPVADQVLELTKNEFLEVSAEFTVQIPRRLSLSITLVSCELGGEYSSRL